MSLGAEGDHLPQNEGAPDGPVSFLLSPSSPHLFLGSPMVSGNASLMKSSLLMLLVFSVCVCVRVHACACVCMHTCSIPLACLAEQLCQEPDRTQCLSDCCNTVALESCLSLYGALSCPGHLSLAFGVSLSNPFAFHTHHHPLPIISLPSGNHTVGPGLVDFPPMLSSPS